MGRIQVNDLNLIQERLSPGQFIAEEHPKSQVYLHHTAGGGDARSVSKFWNSNSSKIATAFVIGERGEIVQCFSSKHWAWHLGVGSEIFKANKIPFRDLNKTSIGIELTNWGMAVKDGMTYAEMFAKVNKKVGGTALAMSETAGMKMQILKLQMGDLSENIGGALAPAFSQLLEKITPVVAKIADWVQKNPELSANIIGISLAITGLLVVLATLSAILPAISLGFALLSSPIGITILIIGGLVGAIYYLYTSWDEIMKGLLLIWEIFKEGLKVILQAIQNEWTIWINYLSMKYNLFITEIKAMWDSIKDYFVNVLNTIKSAWDTVWSGAKQSVIDVWEGIKSTIGEGIAWIESQPPGAPSTNGYSKEYTSSA